jgi:hypothetical protein
VSWLEQRRMFGMKRGERPSFAEQVGEHARTLRGNVLGNKIGAGNPSGQFGHKLAEGVNAAQRRSCDAPITNIRPFIFCFDPSAA